MSQCFKCKDAIGTIASRDGAAKPYCVECFQNFCDRTVRENLLQHCSLPSDTPIAVAVSGGPNSMMLLHQLGILRAKSLQRGGNGAIHYHFLPFHLCEKELIVPPRPSSLVVAAVASAESDAPFRGIDSICATMTEQFNVMERCATKQPHRWVYTSAPARGKGVATSVPLFRDGEVRCFRYGDFLSQDYIAELRQVLHHRRLSLTDREEVYARVKQQVLCRASARLIHAFSSATTHSSDGATTPPAGGWVHMMMGSNAARCAAAALHGLVMGGGGEVVVHSSAFRGYLHQTVVLRPMRTVLPKEAVLYARQYGIATGYTPSLSTGTALRSVSLVLEDFVYTILVSYRTMIFNVLNTVERLEVHPQAMECLLRNDIPEETAGASLQQGGQRQGKRRPLQGRSAQQLAERLRVTAPPSTTYTHTVATTSPSEPPAASAPSSVAAVTTAVLCLGCGCPLAPPLPSDAPAESRAVTAVEAVAVSPHFAFCHECCGVAEQLMVRLGSAPTLAGDSDGVLPAGGMGSILPALFEKLLHSS